MTQKNLQLPKVPDPRPGSGAMFDGIAKQYDMLNALMSLGLDRWWRKSLVDSLQLQAGDKILDVATGTADVALQICRRLENVEVIGIDPSTEMLNIGRQKVEKSPWLKRIRLLEGQVEQLPFEDNAFSACCISFGIRNVTEKVRALSEMTRVVKPGGVVAILELRQPQNSILSRLAQWHVHYMIPLLGCLFSRGVQYSYLRDSMIGFPSPMDFMALMQSAGLKGVRHRCLTFGTVHLFKGYKAS